MSASEHADRVAAVIT